MKVTLIAEPDLVGSVRNPKFSRPQKFETLFNTAFEDELRRRRTGGVLERPRKMGLTKARLLGQLFDGNITVQVRFNVGEKAFEDTLRQHC